MSSSLRRVEVVELRVRGELLFEDEDALRLHHATDLALGVEEVAELPGADGADLDARRVAPAPRPLDAEGALLDDALRPRAVAEVVLVRVQLLRGELRVGPVEVARAVRARRHAAAAPDAPVIVDDDDAVLLLPRRLRRARLHAGRVAALLALHREVELPGPRHRVRVVVQLGVGEIDAVLLLHLEHADPVDLRLLARLVVLLHAGVDAAAAADAARDVEPVAELDAGAGPLGGDLRLPAEPLLVPLLHLREHLREVVLRQLLEVTAQELVHAHAAAGQSRDGGAGGGGPQEGAPRRVERGHIVTGGHSGFALAPPRAP